MKLKLLKFDIIHPRSYLDAKKTEWTDLDSLSLAEYRERLLKLRSNYSDFYTYHLNVREEWEAEEFFLLDETFLEKAARELFGWQYEIKKNFHGRLRTLGKFSAANWRYYVVQEYIKQWNPDVIFVRSQPFPSAYWRRFNDDALLVSRLSARMPWNWHPNHWDIIYTDQPDFKTFFDLHGVKTILNDQGFDARIVGELEKREKQYDTVFIGGLGTQNFSLRTQFMNRIAENVNLKWWGYWWEFADDGKQLQDFPILHDIYQGSTSGLEMFQIYLDSKIVVNDYVDTANGIGFNQRMFEVMGCGGFMLTREAPNFEKDFPEGFFATFKDDDDFLEKVDYYLNHEKEREQIARKGQQFVLENYDYSTIVAEFEKDLKQGLKEKGLLDTA